MAAEQWTTRSGEMSGVDLATGVAAVLAVVLLVDVSVLWLTGKQVPELLGQLIFGVFGFYFGRAPFGRKKEGE
jgi:type IV secretory pathway VirB2 component (pilin)